LLAHSFKLAETQAFKDFTYKRKNELATQIGSRKYRENGKEDNEESDTKSNSSSTKKLHQKPSNDSESSQEEYLTQPPNLFKKQIFSDKLIPKLKTDYLTPLHHRSASAPKSHLLNNEVEEMMVIYYLATVIRLSKFSDALKAINEYKKKKSFSTLAKAHMYKIFGVLAMVNKKKDYKKAKKYFKKSIEKFVDLN
jgi:hypothetical protein